MATDLDLVDYASSASSQNSEVEGSVFLRIHGELIDGILGMLDQPHLLRVIRTCKHLKHHALPILYREIELLIPKGSAMMKDFARHFSYSRSNFKATKELRIYVTEQTIEDEEDYGAGVPDYYLEVFDLGSDEWHVPFGKVDENSASKHIEIGENGTPGITILNMLVYKIVENLTPGRLNYFGYFHPSPLGYQVLQNLSRYQRNITRLRVTEMTLEKPLRSGFSVAALQCAIETWWDYGKDVPEEFAQYQGAGVWAIVHEYGTMDVTVNVPSMVASGKALRMGFDWHLR